jgi:hypothetical protein
MFQWLLQQIGLGTVYVIVIVLVFKNFSKTHPQQAWRFITDTLGLRNVEKDAKQR